MADQQNHAMSTHSPRQLWMILVLVVFQFAVVGCAEVRTLFSVLFNDVSSLSTSAFEVEEIKSGSKVTCGILGDKTLRCLGPGLRGSLGRFYGGPVATLKDVKQVAAGKDFTCAIIGDKGEIFCFGSNDLGQLGVALPNGERATTDPVQLIDDESGKGIVTDAKSLVAGDAHACAMLKAGRVICWGDNSYGQLGNPSQKKIGVRTIFESERNQKMFSGVTDVFAGANSTCIIAREDSSVFCFGERYGVARKINWVPEKIDLAGSIGTLASVKQVGLGRGFGCALSKSSQVYCWGRNDLNQLGGLVTLPAMTKATMVKVTYPQEQPITRVDAIAVGEAHACALHRDEKTLYCWGDNRFGQLGNTSIRGLPEQVALGSNNLTLKGVREVALGPDRTCIISSRDEVFCWGNGAHGILGSPRVMTPYPVRVLDANTEFLSAAQMIAVGTQHACMIDTSAQLYCFGINEYGQLGQRLVSGNVITGELKPIERVTAIDTAHLRTCMVYGKDQSVACFGDREIDNLNQKHELNSFVPEEIKKGMISYRGVLGLSVGKAHLCVITAEQTVECLGDGAFGQLGGGDTQSAQFAVVLNEKKAPIKDIWQIKSNKNWNCSLQQEKGSIWCWGQWKQTQWLLARQLMAQAKPSQDFIQITLSEDQVCGVHGVDREVYCANLGDKPQDQIELVPLLEQEGRVLKKVLTLSGGKNHICALNDEGYVYCWGSNQHGQLGSKTLRESARAIRLSFTRETLKKISRISAGDQHTCVATNEEAAFFCFGESFFGGVDSVEPLEYPL